MPSRRNSTVTWNAPAALAGTGHAASTRRLAPAATVTGQRCSQTTLPAASATRAVTSAIAGCRPRFETRAPTGIASLPKEA